MKKVILFISVFAIALSSQAQIPIPKIDTTKIKSDTLWKKGGVGGINFGQSSFTNWAAGGENSISVTALLSAFANYKKGDITWDNSIDLAYGMLQSGSAPVRKNEDKIDISSKLGRYAFYKHWYYTALLNFKSQFANGYNYPDDSVIISHFMAPGYILGSIGLDYKPNDYFSFFISPVTSKTIVVNDQRLANIGAYGVTPAEYDTVGGVYTLIKEGKKVDYQFGGYIRMTFKKDIFKNVNFATKLELFSNYLKDPQNIAVNWDVLIGLKVNKYLSASISTNMIYDHNIPVPVKREINGVSVEGTGPRLQFKEVLAIGFSYKF